MRFAAPLFVAALAFAPAASATRSTAACFTADEVKKMFEERETVSNAAAQCLKDYWNSHLEFYKANGYSKYFGNRLKDLESVDKRRKLILMAMRPNLSRMLDAREQKELDSADTLANLEAYIQRNPRRYEEYQGMLRNVQLDERVQTEDGGANTLRPNDGIKLQNISCVDMARRCLSEGFKQAGMSDTWAKVDRETLRKDVSGTEMQKALSDLGWKILYWNPDTSRNEAWDQEDQVINPLDPAKPEMKWQGSWGGHAMRWKRVKEKDEYYLGGGERPVKVDDKTTLVNFGTRTPAAFRSVPFFVGTAHSGYHVFPGFSGTVIEAHSSRALNSVDNIQVGEFNPITPDGAPRSTRSEHYRSGIIAVPPGYLDGPGVKPQAPRPVVDAQGCADAKPAARSAGAGEPEAPPVRDGWSTHTLPAR